MRSGTAAIAALFLVTASLTAQRLLPESVKVRRPNPMAALGGRQLVLRHLKPYRSDSGYHFAAGDSIGTVEPYPPQVTRRNDSTLARAESLYNMQRYAEAAGLAERAYRVEPANLFVLNAYARTLFRIPDRRDQSFALYRRLIALLDEEGGTGDTAVAVDMWFREAYWKVASLYLDRGEYQNAAFTITRFLAAPAAPNGPVMTQAIDYLVEAYAHLGDDEMVRLWASEALRLDPRDAYVLPFLYQMGARATTRAATDVLACRPPADTLPPVGPSSFVFYHDTRRCVALRADEDGTVAPCLRIGEVYVGEGRDDVERTLGSPDQSVTQPNGVVAFVYLVFFDNAQRRGAYYVIEYERAEGSEIVRALQLTRDRPPLPVDFSCVLLGDPEERWRQQLGPAVFTAPMEDASTGAKGQAWTYDPLPVSVEIVDHRVYSVRVWRPDNLPARRRRFGFTERR